MRAIVYERYGGPEVLQLRELPSPAPGAGEVLLEVHAAALNPKDSLVRKGKFQRVTGARFPRRLGFDVAGVVRAVGAGVQRLKAGDAVFGMMNGWAGGTVAEQVCLSEHELALKPARASFVEAAALPLVSLTALQALRDEAHVRAGDRVLLHGASGGVGVHAIQLARALGAEVTTTSSAHNLELCRALGAHHAWDYTAQTGLNAGAGWHCFFDIFGNRSFGAARAALAPRGTYVSTVPGARIVLQHLLTRFARRRARLVVVKSNAADLAQLAAWVDAGVLKAVVDEVLPLEEVAAGQAHIETKRARGKVVVQLR